MVKWESIQKALSGKLDKRTIEMLGKSFGKPRIVQEGVTPEEVREQILNMAPGKHPLIGPLLLDLADKL